MSAMDFERNPENVGGVAGYRWGGRVRQTWKKLQAVLADIL